VHSKEKEIGIFFQSSLIIIGDHPGEKYKNFQVVKNAKIFQSSGK